MSLSVILLLKPNCLALSYKALSTNFLSKFRLLNFTLKSGMPNKSLKHRHCVAGQFLSRSFVVLLRKKYSTKLQLKNCRLARRYVNKKVKPTASASLKKQKLQFQVESFLVSRCSKFSRCRVCKSLGYLVIAFLSYILSQEL